MSKRAEVRVARLTPDTREELEDEREFLLRSLADLDNELVAGNIDPDNYRVLHDDYTARAAAVIQSLDDGVAPDASETPKVPPAMRALTVAGIVVFAVLAAVLLAHTIGQRHAGQEITGDAQAGQNAQTGTTTGGTVDVASAKAAAVGQPKSYAAQITYARALLQANAFPAAIQQYLVAAALDPTQAEPLAYAGYATALVSQSVTDATSQQKLLAAAGTTLDKAIAVDKAYPDSYAFKGQLLAQVEHKWCLGAVAFQQFLVNAPADHPLRSQVLTALAQAVTSGKCPEPKTTPTTKP